jgi:hypothetical protein
MQQVNTKAPEPWHLLLTSGRTLAAESIIEGEAQVAGGGEPLCWVATFYRIPDRAQERSAGGS